MIDPKQFSVVLQQQKFDFITGVPCSYFKDFLAYLATHSDGGFKHIRATREDEAIGIASGVAFTGKLTIVYLQNSGLGNIGDALTSLAQLYELPMLMLISYRGLESDQDFPEHTIMGEVSEPLLTALKVPYWTLTEENWKQEIKTAKEQMTQLKQPVALLVKQGVLST